MKVKQLAAGLCSVTFVAGVAVVAVPAGSGPPQGPETHQVEVDPALSIVGSTVTISNVDDDGRCPPFDFEAFAAGAGAQSAHEEIHVRLDITAPSGAVTTRMTDSTFDEDWAIEFTSEEVGVHEIEGACVWPEPERNGIVEFAFAGGGEQAAPAGLNGEIPLEETILLYEGSFTVEEAPVETTTTAAPDVVTTTTAPGPDAAADAQTPPAPPAQASPTFVG